MANLNSRVMAWFRRKKEKPMKKVAHYLVKKGVTANMVTFASLFAGILAVYFLFQNHLLFFLFVLIHLFLDALDGVVARIKGATAEGKSFDLLVDRLVNLGMLLKIASYSESSIASLAVLFFILSQGIYFYTKFEAPAYFTRTWVLIILVIKLPLIAASFAGVMNLYGLYKQYKWFRKKKRSTSLKKRP
ncbi:MAG: CDP-alcohol phosphatidyltransferase family protein [archaeon]|nr:CDP-alcohol phosphatidyltransferase family protein [archaeon]